MLLLGVTYKPDIADQRESPAVPIAEKLRARGAQVSFHDPHVPTWRTGAEELKRVPDLDAALRGCDVVVLLQPHTSYDLDAIARSAPLVLSTPAAVSPAPTPWSTCDHHSRRRRRHPNPSPSNGACDTSAAGRRWAPTCVELWQRRHFALELARSRFRAENEADRLGRRLDRAAAADQRRGLRHRSSAVLLTSSKPPGRLPALPGDRGLRLPVLRRLPGRRGSRRSVANMGLVTTLHFPRAVLPIAVVYQQLLGWSG